ncbi:ecdysone oxidase-like [Anticarsia gemmatalis]|uniref:ecdysone oxidase-like n=1 Tax=Anticarsia gemmatalis TaxID=129554 RepID=UPI003F76AD23
MLINASSSVQNIATIRGALKVLSLLYFTKQLYPEQTCVHDEMTFDYIIIGGGTAGCVIASRLAEDTDATVLLIESGENPESESDVPGLLIYIKESEAAWNYTVEDDETYRQYHKDTIDDMALGRVLGGTSSAGYMIYNVGNRYDYDCWAKTLKDPSWNWKNVLLFFKKSQNLLDQDILEADKGEFYGKDGKIGLSLYRFETGEKVFKIFEEAGNLRVPSFNGNVTHGYADAMYTIANGLRQSTAYSYLTPMKNNPKLHILRNTFVERIVFDDNRNAVGVEVELCNGKHITIRSRVEIILSAGIVNSPKILMLSGIGPKEHLDEHNIETISDLPVGQNFHDHLSTVVIYNMTNLVTPYRPWDPHKYPASVIIGFASLNKTSGYPDYHTVNFINFPSYLMMYCAFTYGYSNEVCDQMIETDVNSIMMYSVISLQKPTSNGKILLRSGNYKDKPKVITGKDNVNAELHARAVQHFVNIEKTNQFEALGGQFKDPEIKECNLFEKYSSDYWKCYVRYMRTTLHNYSGTCAMGKVVDSHLKVYGVNRLRVADASVMPSTPAGGTLGATIMIGEKAADMIKEDNRCK